MIRKSGGVIKRQSNRRPLTATRGVDRPLSVGFQEQLRVEKTSALQNRIRAPQRLHVNPWSPDVSPPYELTARAPTKGGRQDYFRFSILAAQPPPDES